MIEKREEEIKMDPTDLEKDARCSLGEIMDALNGSSDSGDGDGDGGGKIDEPHSSSQSSDSNRAIPTKEERKFSLFLLEGKFRHEDEVLVGPRGPPPDAISTSGPMSGRSGGGMSSSPQGFYVITPLERVNNMGTVLINRGWVPRQYVQQNAAWNRPKEVVRIVSVPSKTEVPRFLSPPHSAKEPRQLLWFDRLTMERKTRTIGKAPLYLKETSATTTTSSTEDGGGGVPQFPVKPSVKTVGEFKVPTSTHAGYAATWYGLSGAGIFMTRKLMMRGRG